MRSIIKRCVKVLNEENGQGMVEYSLILAQVSIIAVSTILLYDKQLTVVFQNALDALKGTFGK